MAFIKIVDIVKQYAGHRALNKVSFDIPEKSIFGLLGPNGAGKTSLIRILTQITAPDSGKIIFNGEKLKRSHIHNMGYLPEERGLYKKMKVREQLIYLARLKDLPLRDAEERTDYWLQRLKLSNWEKKYLADLSKGMQQKVQFIATIIHEPQLIILDEPFSGFDPVNAELIKEEILELRRKGATVILSTHTMESVEEMCDNIALLNNSELVLDGSISDIKSRYKSGKAILRAKGNPASIGVEANLTDGYFDAELTIDEKSSLNDVIQSIVNKVEIHSIKEEYPTIRDIFFKHIKENE